MPTSEKVSHTPGPWEYAPSPYFPARTIYRNGINIARVTEAKGTQFDGLEPTPLVTEANARLIAAAPDLLEALEGMQRALDAAIHAIPNDEDSCIANIALYEECEAAALATEAAIAKARGA